MKIYQTPIQCTDVGSRKQTLFCKNMNTPVYFYLYLILLRKNYTLSQEDSYSVANRNEICNLVG